MSHCKKIFLTATGTDAGKTYIAALMYNSIKQTGAKVGYFKAAASGISQAAEYANGLAEQCACLEGGTAQHSCVVYTFSQEVSPHLAARINHKNICKKDILTALENFCKNYDFVIIEGSGGAVCPLMWEQDNKLMLTDVMALANCPTIIVCNAGLGAINAAVTTYSYLQAKGINIGGIILNNYDNSLMQQDNLSMVQQLCNTKVLATIYKGETNFPLNFDEIIKMFSKGDNAQ